MKTETVTVNLVAKTYAKAEIKVPADSSKEEIENYLKAHIDELRENAYDFEDENFEIDTWGMLDTEDKITCHECGKEMTPVMYREEEYVRSGISMCKTGRYRISHDGHFVCEFCGAIECVDSEFMAGPWIMERS